MPASLIVSAFALEGFAAAAVTLATHILTTLAINSLINRDQPNTGPTNGTQGGPVTLQPATDNKLPVVYGDAWVSPVIVDAKISKDQQTMWYVLAFSEATDNGTISFDRVYWDSNLLLFDPANPNTIRGWFIAPETPTAQGTTVTGPGGKISMWFYNKNSTTTSTQHVCIDGAGNETLATTDVSAISVLQDAGIDSTYWWDDTKTMDNTVFAVMRVNYDQAHGITTFPTNMKALIKNSLNQPGDCMMDYLQNSRYGCGVSSANIDTQSFADLNTFSNEQISLINQDNTPTPAFKRYVTNGYVKTTNDCLTNLVQIADCADSWVQWNEATGQWGVKINRSYTEAGLTSNDLYPITKDHIIGGIQISPLDLNSTYNSFKVSFPNGDTYGSNGLIYRGQTDYRYYELPAGSLNPNEPNNELSLTLDYTNDSRQATYVGYKRLFSSREDLIINFTMDYNGIVIDAGDIVKITHEWYGWTDKLFRVTQIKEVKDGEGFLSVQITASSYNDAVYVDAVGNPLHIYNQASFNNLGDPNVISQPGKPTVGNVNTATSPTFFSVYSTIPASGHVESFEFWYGNTSTFTTNNFALYETQNYMVLENGKPVSKLYPSGETEYINVAGIPAGTYYWVTKAIGPNGTSSDFSELSDPWVWTAEQAGSPVNGAKIQDNSISGSKVISGDPATVGGSQSKGFFDTMGPLLIAGLGAAAIGYGYKQGVFDGVLPDFLLNKGSGGNDAGSTVIDPSAITRFADANGNPTDTPSVGGFMTTVLDATPLQDSPIQVAQNDGLFGGLFSGWGDSEA